MAKMPGWIKQVGWMRGDDNHATIIVRIRWWHPGAWLAVARVIGDEMVRRILRR